MGKCMVVFMIAVTSFMLWAGCNSSNDVIVTESGDKYIGGLIWLNWTDSIAGGSGYPADFDSGNKDFLRCKACHGWDAMGANGGYVRRTASASRPNPTGGTDLSIDFVSIVADEVWHTNGRDFTTLDTSMPAYDQTDGLTQQQVDDVLAFLSSGPKIGDYATLDINTDPVTYTFTSPNLAEGETLYTANCSSCHPTVGTAGVGPALGPYFEGDGKYSEGFHKVVYGAGGTSSMTRAASGSLTGQQAADILAYIQAEIEGTPIPTGDEFDGGLVWLNWTDAIAGGSGYPAGFDSGNKDFLRCKACHGWDAMGANGGYVRRSNNATRPNPSVGTDLSADFASIVANEVWHTNGRDFTTNDNTMPAFDQTGGLTQQQADDVLSFLNSGPKIGDYATLDTSTDPVTYTFSSPDLAAGETLYGTNCSSCHPTVDTAGVGPALDTYFAGDGKYSEGFHKAVYGAGGTSIMTRAASGNLTGQQAADILAYIQAEIEGSQIPLGDEFDGGLVWLNWTDAIAGGSGYPDGFDSGNKDFLRCKACHGWDAMGANGGYVRRTASATRPNPSTGTDLSADWNAAPLDAVWHTNGRDFTTLDNSMPAYDQAGGLTQQQVGDVLTFLESGSIIIDYATLDINTDPVTYTFNSPNLTEGETLYGTKCAGCHSTVDSQIGGVGPAVGPYFAGDGKFSEGFHKMVYGAGGTSIMTRAASGNLTGRQAADILAYIQANM